MPRINLLPWREELRRERQKEFAIQMAGAAILGGLMLFYAHSTVGGWVDHQEDRNSRIQDEIRQLEQQIAEIEELQETRERLLSRMQIIEELQKSRPDGVRLFDDLVESLPSGVYLTQLNQSGANITIRGVAESQARVSAYLRSIDDAEWLDDPDLDGIQRSRQRDGDGRVFEFTIRARQVTPGTEND
ncbi:type IV pilus assembly protein PilN [Natronospira proteinivora]|uniref:Type IV pilus assembly protein PilN n=1 Tax=Natronospira proteinivora TaxID=1807133 RepID=A0ABT1GAR8_9GAMM|nr:PilN domain-containing protein [Natronospira proteinivora]MCP1728005.1 type IV pilus assembly protein PilN [Natronospira proteinivora]